MKNKFTFSIQTKAKALYSISNSNCDILWAICFHMEESLRFLIAAGLSLITCLALSLVEDSGTVILKTMKATMKSPCANTFTCKLVAREASPTQTEALLIDCWKPVISFLKERQRVTWNFQETFLKSNGLQAKQLTQVVMTIFCHSAQLNLLLLSSKQQSPQDK